MLNDEHYMRQALVEAQKAFERNEVPVGSVLVCRDRIIARGHNLTETLTDVTAHAELQAVSSAANYLDAKYLKSCTLFVTLEPCQMCAGALYWSQVSRVVWGASDEKRGFQTMGGQLHPKTKVTTGILADECAALMRSFFEKKR